MIIKRVTSSGVGEQPGEEAGVEIPAILEHHAPVRVTAKVGGRLYIDAKGVYFDGTYSFEQTDDDGITTTWTGIRPRREGDAAVFDLTYKKKGT